MSKFLDELIAGINSKAPETEFVEKIASVTAPEGNAVAAVDEDAEFKKIAEQTDALARIQVRSQYDEWMKIANELQAAGVDPATLVANPAVQVANVPVSVQNAAQASAIVRQLTNGAEQKGPVGTIEVNNAPTGAAQPQAVVDEAPIAFDAAKVAEASNRILSALYTNVYGA